MFHVSRLRGCRSFRRRVSRVPLKFLPVLRGFTLPVYGFYGSVC